VKPAGVLHDQDGRLAQVVEQLTLNQRVAGSNPASPTILRRLKAADGNYQSLTIDKLRVKFSVSTKNPAITAGFVACR
jgi:hypothetical protein